MPLFGRKRKKGQERVSPQARLTAAVNAAFRACGGREDYGMAGAGEERVPALGEPGLVSGSLAFRGTNIPWAAWASGDAADTASLLRGVLAGLGFPSSENDALCEIDMSGQADAFLWQVLELKGFRFSRGKQGSDAWLWLSNEAWDSIDASSGSAPANPSAAFRVERPSDLPILDAFAAREFTAASHALRSDYGSFSFSAGDAALAGLELPQGSALSWFKASFERLDGQGQAIGAPVGFLYALGSAEASPPGQSKALIAALFSESARRFVSLSGSKLGRLGLSPLDSAPDLSSREDLFCLSFSLRVSAARLPGAVVCPWSACAALGEGAGAAMVSQANNASVFLEWNSAMLARALPGLLSCPPERQGLPGLTLNGLLRLLSDKDFALAVQNCLLPGYGAKGIPALLSYNASSVGADGKPREIAVPFGPLDPWRLEAFLPESFREDFRLQARSMSGVTAERCAQSNREALRQLSRAALSGRIAASPRMILLLRRLFLDAERAEEEKKLASMKESGIPFALLRGMDPRAAQRVCASIPDRQLALALLDCENEFPALRKFVSSSRTGRLREDLPFLRKGMKEGTLGPSDAIAAKEAIAASIEADKEREARERERALEKGKPDGAQPGSPRFSRR